MLAQSNLSPIIDLEAKIQSKVANFLILKERIVNLVRYPSPSIQTKAKELLIIQNQLEKKLQEVLDTIDVIKSGSWSFSNIIDISSFYARMEKQFSEVNKLEKSTKKHIPVSEMSLMDYKWLLPIGAGLVLYKIFK